MTHKISQNASDPQLIIISASGAAARFSFALISRPPITHQISLPLERDPYSVPHPQPLCYLSRDNLFTPIFFPCLCCCFSSLVRIPKSQQ